MANVATRIIRKPSAALYHMMASSISTVVPKPARTGLLGPVFAITAVSHPSTAPTLTYTLAPLAGGQQALQPAASAANLRRDQNYEICTRKNGITSTRVACLSSPSINVTPIVSFARGYHSDGEHRAYAGPPHVLMHDSIVQPVSRPLMVDTLALVGG